MKNKKWIMVAVALAVTSTSALASQVYIDGKWETRLSGVRAKAKVVSDHKRCVGTGSSQQQCSSERDIGYQDNCISSAEKAEMTNKNLYPVCKNPRRYAPAQRLGAVCSCGCFEPSSQLYVQNAQNQKSAWKNVVELRKNITLYKLWSLADDASLSKLEQEPRSISYSTHGEEHVPLYFIEVNGTTLGLTSKHGVLLANGQMATAESLKIGQELVSADGKAVAIDNITQHPIDEEVINFLIEEDDHNYNSHLIIARGAENNGEGVIVGDLVWQNNLAGELENIKMRQ